MTAQVEQLQQSVDKVAERLSELRQAVTANNAECAMCRKEVMGNGQRGHGDRLTTIETRYRVTSGMIFGLCMVVGSLSSIIGAVVAVVCS